MPFRKTKHVAIYVLDSRFGEAVAHYSAVFGISGRAAGDCWEFATGDQMVYVDRSSDGVERVIQEYEPFDEVDPRAALLGMGCRLYSVNGSSDSTHGFYLEDPFGVVIHVFMGGE